MAVKNTDYFTTLETSQRLDLIRHLIENSEIVPLVRGPIGIGKSLLAARIRQLAPDNWSVCLFEASAALSPEHLLTYLARCSGCADVDEDPMQGLVRRFESMREQGQVPVILVDDAHLLPPTGLITLLRLFERQRAGAPLVSIVLFADERIDMLLSTPQLQIMSTLSIRVIDFQPLTREDATSFMHFLLQVESLPADLELTSSKLTKLYRETKGIPGLLRQEILNKIGNRGEGLVPKAKTPLYAFYIATPILILIAGVLFFQDRINRHFQNSETNREQLSGEHQNQKPFGREIGQEHNNTEPLESALPQQPRNLAPGSSMASVGLVAEVLENKAEYTEISVVESESSVAHTEEEMVVQEVIEVDTEEGVGNSLPTQMPEEQLAPSAEPAYKSEPSSEIQALPEVDEHPQQSVVVIPETVQEVGAVLDPVVKPQDSSEPLPRDEWIRLRPAEHYTLQILGVEGLESLNRFVNKHGLEDEVFYIKTQRNGKPWYALLWGEFPDKLSAIDAQQNLPPAVRSSGVWLRTYGELQKLLEK